MNCACGKFGDCSFSRFGSIMWTDTETPMQTHTDVDKRFSTTTLVGSVSKYVVRSEFQVRKVRNELHANLAYCISQTLTNDIPSLPL